MTNLLIRGGTLVDGTGAPAREADVRIEAGFITEVGTNLKASGERELDASGAYVTPGMIEQHTHYDGQFWWDPYCDPMPSFGTTTVVIGNCGHSLAPIRSQDRSQLIDLYCFIEDLPNEAFEKAIPWTWESWPEYAAAASKHPLAINAAPLVGHTAIRIFVMGDEAWERPATKNEIDRMAQVLNESLAAGAFGLSNGTMDVDRDGRPVPCRLASDDERRRLYQILKEEDRILMHAVRLMEPEHFGSDLEQLAEDMRATKVRATWAALMSTPGEESIRAEILNQHRQYVNEGLDLWGQTSGRPQFGSVNFERSILFQGIDAWHLMVNSSAEIKEKMLRDPAWREQARTDWDSENFRMFPTAMLGVLAVDSCKPEYEELRGMPLDQLIEKRGGGHPSDALATWLVDNGTVGTGFAPLAPPNRDLDGNVELIEEPSFISGGSDAGAHIQIMCAAGESTYVLTEHVRDSGRLLIEDAVHAYSQKQAQTWGIHDRGVIAPGYAADLAIFDLAELEHPENIIARDLPCDSWRYTKPAPGFRATIVNGVPTWLEGGLTGQKPGGFLDPTARPR
ncbi:MAG: amidohydrolase family protein [Myxococcota bacterium]|jgi:N-acyl-D-aspartate/D-glutamate deacylase